MKLATLGVFSIFFLRNSFLVGAQDCPLTVPSSPIERSLSGLSGISFDGFSPQITRIEGEPMIKILGYNVEPILEVVEGKLVVTAASCLPQVTGSPIASPTDTGAPTTSPTTSPTMAPVMDEATSSPTTSGAFGRTASSSLLMVALTSLFSAANAPGMAVMAGAVWVASNVPVAFAQECGNIIEVEIHGPVKSLGETYMEDFILWPEYDMSEGSLHFTDTNSRWSNQITAARAFRETASGSEYNYRNKVLMGLAQTRILNDSEETTPKEDVVFDIPVNVTRPAMDEAIMMLSVLEMQALLRQGDLTSVELTNIALGMLAKYDPEYNMLEVSLTDLALRLAEEADALIAEGTFLSPIHGIPFAVKDTYDVAGYATAYGSFEFLDNIVETESPLVTYAVNAGGIPLFKSSVPQLTYGNANYNGTVYSCLNGGYAGGAGSTGGSSLGSGAAVCLGVVPVAICEQTGSSCQGPAIGNGISTVIPAIGTFSRENNGLYSMESDRPGLLCRDILSCAVFYNYMRGTSPGDPQSRDVPFSDPSKEDISMYSIAFIDNSERTSLGFDTPLKGQRNNVRDALVSLGANVTEYENMADLMVPTQLYLDWAEAGFGNTLWWDWYFLNVESFFEGVFMYGGAAAPDGTPQVTYGPVWRGQNYNFDFGSQDNHIGASAYGVLEAAWIFGYVAEKGVYPMLEQLPDVVVHFSTSELPGSYNNGLIKRAGINTVHIPEFYWNTTAEEFVDWVGTKPVEYYSGSTVSAAMITCESKKYEPVKAFAVCYQLQQALVEGGKLISPYKDLIQEAIRRGEHDNDCPYDWSVQRPDYLDTYPAEIRERVLSKLSYIGNKPTCS
eukprot:scaffold464_cov181-Amphora_coffeaeformis.AAC.30